MSKHSVTNLLQGIPEGDFRSLAKGLTLVENMMDGSEELLTGLPFKNNVPIVGITGPPGAGKSSLTDALISLWTAASLKIGVIAVDPTSPFNFGALLGDRIRLSRHFNSDNVFIRSMASRGALGGLNNRIVEATDLMKNAGFDLIVVETVGVGQSEVDIAGLADTTLLVLVPESGDDVQVIKSGIMEVGDIFVVNKADREGAEAFASNLKKMLHAKEKTDKWEIPVLMTSALNQSGVEELVKAIQLHQESNAGNQRKYLLLAQKAWNMISEKRMANVEKTKLEEEIKELLNNKHFNLYSYIRKYI
jgi:LAO/AO transport system kinase